MSAASRERLELLAEAGCALFHCGVEAGDPTLRRETLNRRTPDEVLVRVFDDARDLDLETSASVMTGLPGETFEQASETVALLRRLRPDSFMWSSYMALPSTVLGDRCSTELGDPPLPRERLDDDLGSMTRSPSAMSEEERRQIHAELEELRAEQVVRAARVRGGARERRVAVPAADGPVERPPASAAEPDIAHAAAERLGLLPPSAARSAAFRVNRAEWEQGDLLVEIESADVAPHLISVGPADGRPSYVTNANLRFAHRGRDAPAPVLAELERLARTLDASALAPFDAD